MTGNVHHQERLSKFELLYLFLRRAIIRAWLSWLLSLLLLLLLHDEGLDAQKLRRVHVGPEAPLLRGRGLQSAQHRLRFVELDKGEAFDCLK